MHQNYTMALIPSSLKQTTLGVCVHTECYENKLNGYQYNKNKALHQT